MKLTGGRIVNVTSRGAFRGEPAHPAYGASKAGLNALG
jgi:3-oxoacyl-[acyl-carrier protein] reductase